MTQAELLRYLADTERHLRDIADMLAVSGPELDIDYVSLWANRLGVERTWGAVRRAG